MFLLALRQIAGRTRSTASRKQFAKKVPEKQKLFQEDDGILEQLKCGVAVPSCILRAAVILKIGGTAEAVCQLALASLPKKRK